jgi:NitT/TauT family transport system substrate-binding protein
MGLGGTVPAGSADRQPVEPGAQAAQLGGLSEIRSHATIIPFAIAELESGKTHLLLTLDDVMAPGATAIMAYVPTWFHDANPELYAATARAFEDAIDWINDHPAEAAQVYVAHEPRKEGAAWIETMLRNPALVRFSATPRGMQAHADFMHAIGTLKARLESWKALFWENMWSKDGS